jgi:hypothetical protein
MPPLTDSDPMPEGCGEHAGTPMGNVPAEYLDWLMGQPWFTSSRKWAPVRQYVLDNWTVIQAELNSGDD